MFLFIPPEILDQEADIKRFVSAMIYKLRKNAHKGHWPNMDVKKTLARMKDELAELEQAIEENNEVEILLECADVANFALILSNIAIGHRHDKPEREDARIRPPLDNSTEDQRTERG